MRYWPDGSWGVRYIIAAIAAVGFALAVGPQPTAAAGCDEWLRQTVRVTGSYVPAKQAYSRPFVFAMLVDCHGSKELVTVQRPTGNFPICEPGEPVEVAGNLIWNKALVDGHYEINSPSSVTCRPVSGTALNRAPESISASPGPAPVPPLASQKPPASVPTIGSPRAESSSPPLVARETGARVWTGRYRDSRGEGDMTFSLVQGESTVSGTWRVRIGGGGPLTGIAEAGGRRFNLRMENTAPACPGTFEGWMQIDPAVLVGAYRGHDCEGQVSDGRFELHPR